MFISKSAQDGYLGKQEILKEIKDRLRWGKLKIEDIEGIIKDWYAENKTKETETAESERPTQRKGNY